MLKRIGNFFTKICLCCKDFCVKYARVVAHYVKSFFQKASKHVFWMVIMLVSFITGVLLLALPASLIIDYIYITLGLVIVVLGFIKLAKFKDGRISNYYEGTLNIVLGILVMFAHKIIIMIIVGLLLVALPIYRIIKSNDKRDVIHHQLVYLGLGLVIIFGGEFFQGFFIKLLGILLVALAGKLGYLLWIQDDCLNKRNKVIIEEEKIVNVCCEEVIVDEKED